ncbi:MAG TPA: purine-nucleoside phosphorylase, partial [Terriglobales bacterium]|nr:purine-nucleoside phosphorylase [Terriglobales bacterium]
GSGLGAFADSLLDSVAVEYSTIPHYPRATAIGHAGRLVIGTCNRVPVAAMQGRVHFYEGLQMADVVFPMRVFARMGIRAAVLTNAAGGINRSYKQGALVVISDHINLQGTSPLVGINDERFGPRFPDMTHAYSRRFRQLALAAGKQLGLDIYEGVYAAMHGPQYETPAEIRFLHTIGADLVGMSTVSEVIAARHMGIEVLAISCVTNMAAGIIDQPLNHQEVLETGRKVQAQFIALIEAIVPQIASDLS